MDNLLNYYYNLLPSKIIKCKNNFFFNIQNNNYFFVLYERTETEINSILKIIDNKYHQIIINKDKKHITKYNDSNYVLLKLSLFNEQLSLTEILLNSSKEVSNKDLYRGNWETLWSEKIDYLEYQITQLGNKYPILQSSLDYYIGLGENAISLVNTINKTTNQKKNVICHRKITYPLTTNSFYNPLNIIIDIKERDIAEYLKILIFNDIDPWDYIDEYIESKPSNYEINMFYSRMLYPTYYFKTYDRILKGEIGEVEIINVISKSKEYELFLKDLYEYLVKYYNIPMINWLIKKDLITDLH